MQVARVHLWLQGSGHINFGGWDQSMLDFKLIVQTTNQIFHLYYGGENSLFGCTGGGPACMENPVKEIFEPF